MREEMNVCEVISVNDMTLSEAEMLNGSVDFDRAMYLEIVDSYREYPVGCTDEELLAGEGALFNDPSPKLYDHVQVEDTEAFESFCIYQERLVKGRDICVSATKERDAAYRVYARSKDRFVRVKDILNGFQSTGGNISQWNHWGLFNRLKVARNEAWEKFQSIKEHTQKLWDHYNKVKEEQSVVIESICLEMGMDVSSFWSVMGGFQFACIFNYFTDSIGQVPEEQDLEEEWIVAENISLGKIRCVESVRIDQETRAHLEEMEAYEENGVSDKCSCYPFYKEANRWVALRSTRSTWKEIDSGYMDSLIDEEEQYCSAPTFPVPCF